MVSDAQYLRVVSSSLPLDVAAKIQDLCNSATVELVLDTLIRFVVGAECPSTSSFETRQEWPDRQRRVKENLDKLIQPSDTNGKRRREEEETESSSESQSVKRQKLPVESAVNVERAQSQEDDASLFTLHSISTTSPIRKKVDITIHASTIKFTHPSTRAIEASVALSTITRAFLLPTRGKQKSHWTVVLLSSDAPDRGKSSSTATQSNLQIIFGIDALAIAPLTTTSYQLGSEPTVSIVPKGSATLPSLREFLSHLAAPIFEPSTEIFRSATAGMGPGGGGVPGIEAYRAAKSGSLWFLKEGILWGEGKPCEFWSVEDLISKSDGLRMVGGAGRTCSVILTRKPPRSEDENDGEEGEGEGIESEFGVIDAREQDGINQWVRQFRHLFGKKKVVQPVPAVGQASGSGPVAANQIDDDSDLSDSSFEADSEDLDDGSATSSDDESDMSGREEGALSGEEEGVLSGEGSEGGEDEEEELKPENHPLMRPGAMPRMSRAAIDMVVNMVEEDLTGPGGGEGGDSEEEEDQLDD